MQPPFRTLPLFPEPRNTREGRPDAHGRHPRPAHLPSQSRFGYLRPCNVPGPGISSLTWLVPSVPPLEPPTARVPAHSNPGPSSPAEPGHLRSHPVLSSDPTPASCKPASQALPRRPPSGLIQSRHSPRIPSLRKGSVSFPSARATNPAVTGGAWPRAGPTFL